MKLELWWGNFVTPWFINIDVCKFTPDTIIHDLNFWLPWDLESDTVEQIRADNVLEHIENLIPLMNDCWRVLKKWGTFEIIVPLFPTIWAIKDPTHVRFFIPESFDYFDKDWDYEKKPDYNLKLWTVKGKKIIDVSDCWNYKNIRVILTK